METTQITVPAQIIAVNSIDQRDDLEENVKYLLAFGKFIGIYPHGSPVDRVTRAIPLILGLIAVVDLIGINLLNPSSVRIRTATDLAGDFGVPGFYILGAFLYFYIQSNVHQLQKIFTRWKEVEAKHSDVRLKRYVNVTSFVVLVSSILENATFHFKLFPVFENLEAHGNKSTLEVYYQRSHGHWAIYVPYNPVVPIILFITNKCALYSWNFADVFVAVLCRALYFRFSSLHRDPDTLSWENVRFEYLQLTDITRMLETFLSPMIFACYSLNMYAICMQLHMWLTPSHSTHYLHTLYLAWSFVHLLGRVLLVSLNAAKVHEEIQTFERVVQDCPNEKYSIEIQRLEVGNTACGRGLGLTGLGCFLITKPFILSLFSVAFTFEVFLLQSDTIKLG